MWKRIKILILKIKWVLFGKKPIKQLNEEINSIKGIEVKKPVKKLKVSNGNYASTKRHLPKNRY